MNKTEVRQDGIIKIIPGDRFTPYSLAVKLKAKVILESSSYKKGRERYSLLMLQEAFRVSQTGEKILFSKKSGGKTTHFEIKNPGRDILDALMYFARQHPNPAQDFPFPAGGIGYLGWEFSARCDTIRLNPAKADPLGIPEGMFLFGHVFAVFDHYTDLIYLIGLNYKEAEIDLAAAVGEVEKRIQDLDFNYMASGEKKYPARILSNLDQEKIDYMKGVEEVRKEIIAGNLLQGVLSRRLEVETDISALEAYRSLRSNNPSPYLFLLDFDDFQLFGASPEVHVKVKDGVGTIQPIAGTRRRGATEEEDRALEKELLADVKERAEHLMLVDLARNDLGRICVPGSVQPKEIYTVERYSHVMHLVSKVEGKLKDDKIGIDALRATFPAGTVSGAPKIRAIEVLDRLEPVKRSFYAGVVGYLDADGSLDTCISIRCALKKDGRLVLQAGAGLVYDSKPEREWEETNEKLRALAASVGLEV